MIETIFASIEILATIEESEIFNFAIVSYLHSVILPEISNFYRKTPTCTNCNTKQEIIYDRCFSCNSELAITQSYSKIVVKLQQLKKVIEKFSLIELSEFTKDLI